MEYILEKEENMFKKLKNFLRRLFRAKGVYYVNGPDLLPPPLTHEDEAKAIAALPEDEKARARLIEHNLRLVVYIARRFESTGVGLEDLVSIGTVGLIKAINTFSPEKNIKLATYASRCIENEILMYIRKKNARRGEVSFDEPLHVDWDGNELLLSDVLGSEEDGVGFELEKKEERRVINEALLTLSPRERLIVELRFGFAGKRELTQKEVADSLGISPSYISRLEKKIIAELKEKIAGKI